MKKIGLKTHAIFILAVSITILHFILTSIVGHYAATQIGSSAGQVVAEGLVETTEGTPSEKQVNEIYQNIKNKSNEIISRWKIPLFLISLPIKPVIHPLLKMIRKAWIYEPVLAKKISKDQFKTREKIIENVANSLNSLTFGLLIYLAFKIILKKKRGDIGHS